MSVCGILVAAGSGTRMGLGKNKALLPLLGEPLFLHAVRALRPFCDTLILVVKEDEQPLFESALHSSGLAVDDIALGGRERRHSVENALVKLPPDAGIILVHDAARPFPSPRLILDVLAKAKADGAAVPALPVLDTLRSTDGRLTKTVSRENLYRVQTPQGFLRETLLLAYGNSPDSLTDDAGLVELMGHPVTLTRGDARNLKITTREDFSMAEALILGSLRFGTGFDAHRLAPGRKLILGGAEIPFELGLLGHSDADAALHALTDALLGACALGDIGRHFPDSEERYRGISSLLLLEKTREIVLQAGFVPWQCDLTILAQRPRLSPYIETMRQNIAQALQLPLASVSVKATTTEGMGYEGRGEGISAQALAVVRAVSSSPSLP